MTKFLNISTDNTLGGASSSDEIVSSQKAIKSYVDSQTGTAPAFSNITGSPYDNTNLSSALNSKQDEISDLNDIRSGASAGATALQPNTSITGATKCKITYDSKGLVTTGDDLASSDVTTALGYTPANQDLSNLTSVGKNISNWSNNMTNCFSEIPQDIDLIISNGTTTLKEGSKVYIPNGSGVFNALITSEDKTISQIAFTDTYLLFYAPNNTIFNVSVNSCYSGTSAPSGQTYMIWYDLTNNVVKYTSNSGSTWTSGYSLPFAVISSVANTSTSIDKVFNGIGYIGVTHFFLPNLKALAPAGRNQDGTLKNTIITTSTVKTVNTSDGTNERCIFANGNFDLNRSFAQNYFVQTTEPSTSNTLSWWYNPETNLFYKWNGSAWEVGTWCLVSTDTVSSSRVTSINHKNAFQAVDYNDKSFIATCGMPSLKYKNLTLGTSGTSYIAPANGYFYFAKNATATGQYLQMGTTIGVINKSATGSGYISSFIPVMKGASCLVVYNLGGDTVQFRFVYAEGEV